MKTNKPDVLVPDVLVVTVNNQDLGQPPLHKPLPPTRSLRHVISITNEVGSVIVSGELWIVAPSLAKRKALKALYRKTDLAVYKLISQRKR